MVTCGMNIRDNGFSLHVVAVFLFIMLSSGGKELLYSFESRDDMLVEFCIILHGLFILVV